MATPTAEQINGALQGFDRLYGLELLACSDTEVRARVAVRAELKQPAGLVHGGVYASMAESMASLATALAVLDRGEMAMGLSNSTSFLRPVTAVGRYGSVDDIAAAVAHLAGDSSRYVTGTAITVDGGFTA